MYCNEIRPYWLLATKGYGFSVEDIDMSCPADLEPYSKAYMLAQKEADSNMWAWWGTYGLSATLTAIDRALNGNKARAKYIEKSLNEQYSKDNEPKYKESNEEIAVYEMKQRINALRRSGLPESPD